MSVQQRARAMRRAARESFYRNQEVYGRHGVTNWRMVIARALKVPVAEVRRLLGESGE